MNVGRNTVITKDNVKLDIEASVAYRVINPIIAHYVLGERLNQSIVQLTVSSLRDAIGQHNLDGSLS